MPNLLLNIDVPDLEAAAAFYVNGLDLRVGRRLTGRSLELLGAQCPIYLLEKPEGSAPFAGASRPRSYARHWSPVHLDFAVSNLEEALVRAERAGALAEGEIVEAAWGRMALLSDPFGNGFCLLEFRGAGYDAILEAR